MWISKKNMRNYAVNYENQSCLCPRLPVPANNSSQHWWYRRQSKYNESISLIVPEYQSWFLHNNGKWIWKKLQRFFSLQLEAQQQQQYSKMHLHCTSFFTSLRSPATSVSIPMEHVSIPAGFSWNLQGPFIPIPCSRPMKTLNAKLIVIRLDSTATSSWLLFLKLFFFNFQSSPYVRSNPQICLGYFLWLLEQEYFYMPDALLDNHPIVNSKG